jgi:hypothetical protein
MKKITSSCLALLAALASTATLAQVTIPSTAPRAPTPTLPLAPGLYVVVLDGQIRASTPAGTTNFTAGQFGYTASVTKPPVVVPANPALKFTPPATFSATGPAAANNTSGSKSGAVDCVVR